MLNRVIPSAYFVEKRISACERWEWGSEELEGMHTIPKL